MNDTMDPVTAFSCPLGLFNFPPGSILVEDADEEILELYMDLATTREDEVTEQGGLGFLDSTKSMLQIDLLLTPKPAATPTATHGTTGGAMPRRGRAGGRAAHRQPQAQEDVVGVQVQQDLSALKGRKGDTGSVLWRSSLHLARHILAQHRFPPLDEKPLLDPVRLSALSILELGAGTGLLALLLAPICRAYTASDRLENLQLVARNLALNSVPVDARSSAGAVDTTIVERSKTVSKKNRSASAEAPAHAVTLEEIDWVEVSRDREKKRQRANRDTTPHTNASSLRERHHLDHDSTSDGDFGIVLAVDCIYNENLVASLVDTFAEYTRAGGRTLVWVVVELRSSDVLTLFLETWLQHDSGPWHIVRLGPGAMGQWDGHKPRWVGWVGWR